MTEKYQSTDPRVETRFIDIKTADGVCDAFIAAPAGQESGPASPAVLFYMDAYGPRPYLYAMAEKLAAHGYYVLLPNVFYRYRQAPVVDGDFPLSEEGLAKAREIIYPLVRNFDFAGGLRDAEAYLNFLTEQKHVDAERIAAIGYCMGGGYAIRTAARFPERVAKVAGFHGGRLVTDQADSPHRQLSQMEAELYIAHADNDQSMTAEQIEVFEQAMKDAGIRGESELYQGAAHGFTMADLPAYNAEALKKHWQKLLGFLAS